jgi:hypothetical protein
MGSMSKTGLPHKKLDLGTTPVERIDPAQLVDGIDITPAGSIHKVYALRESIVVVHTDYIVLLCTDCGQMKGGQVYLDSGLSDLDAYRIQKRINELAGCCCLHTTEAHE